MRRVTILFFLLVASSALIAQQYAIDVTEGADFKKRLYVNGAHLKRGTVSLRGYEDLMAVVEFNGNVYAVGAKYNTGLAFAGIYADSKELFDHIALYELDESMDVVREIKLPLTRPAMNKEVFVTKIEKCGNRLLAFFEYENPKLGKSFLFVSSINVESASVKTRKIAEYSTSKGGDFNIQMSEDHKNFKVITTRYNQLKGKEKRDFDNKKGKKSREVKVEEGIDHPYHTYIVGTYDEEINLTHSHGKLEIEAAPKAVLLAVNYTENGSFVAVTANDTLTGGKRDCIVHVYADSLFHRIPMAMPDVEHAAFRVLPGRAGDTLIDVFVLRNTNSWEACRAEIRRIDVHSGKMRQAFELPESLIEKDEILAGRSGRGVRAKRDTTRFKFSIRTCMKNPDGSYSLLLERSEHWSVTTQQKGSNGTGSYSRTTNYYRYGPGILVKWNPEKGQHQHARVDYERLYVNYDPEGYGQWRMIDSALSVVFTPESSAVIHPGDNTATGKFFFPKGTRRGESSKWITQLFQTDRRYFLYALKKGKVGSFSELKIVPAEKEAPRRK